MADLSLKVPFRFDSIELLWVVEEVYSSEECTDFISLIESKNPSLATNNPMYRDQDRVIIDSIRTSSELFERLKPHLPQKMGDFKLQRLNERLRFYRYKPGQKFAPHMDHWYQPNDSEISLLTVLVYLNSDFTGGETRFMEQIETVVEPKQGAVAIFQHKIRHEGCEVMNGVKYAFRTDVIYSIDD
jgi:Rps23 Pro-64 3,4-dihydroxylase Tpa1-like proline 4-hydroxylase